MKKYLFVLVITLSSLSISNALINRNLSVGSRGNDVKEIQQTLRVEDTGYFGNLTKKAVIEWQKNNYLPPTGYFGPMSRGVWNDTKNIKINNNINNTASKNDNVVITYSSSTSTNNIAPSETWTTLEDGSMKNNNTGQIFTLPKTQEIKTQSFVCWNGTVVALSTLCPIIQLNINTTQTEKPKPIEKLVFLGLDYNPTQSDYYRIWSNKPLDMNKLEFIDTMSKCRNQDCSGLIQKDRETSIDTHVTSFEDRTNDFTNSCFYSVFCSTNNGSGEHELYNYYFKLSKNLETFKYKDCLWFKVNIYSIDGEKVSSGAEKNWCHYDYFIYN